MKIFVVCDTYLSYVIGGQGFLDRCIKISVNFVTLLKRKIVKLGVLHVEANFS